MDKKYQQALDLLQCVSTQLSSVPLTSNDNLAEQIQEFLATVNQEQQFAEKQFLNKNICVISNSSFEFNQYLFLCGYYENNYFTITDNYTKSLNSIKNLKNSKIVIVLTKDIYRFQDLVDMSFPLRLSIKDKNLQDITEVCTFTYFKDIVIDVEVKSFKDYYN
jgi:hypothetical protein